MKLPVALALLVALPAIACSSAPPPDASTTSAYVVEPEGGGSVAPTCPDYGPNPACSAESFVKKAWELAQQDPYANTVGEVAAAVSCVAGLTTIGAITVGSDGTLGPVAIGAATLGAVDGCRSLGIYFGKIGLGDAISCFFEPYASDPAIQLCQCQVECIDGLNNSGEFGDYSPPRAWTYGFLDRFGSANCYCTDNAREARCQWHCEHGFRSSDPNDCTCNE